MKRNSLFRSPLFWGGLTILALVSAVFLYFNFEKANPMVKLQLEMSREQALARATLLAENLKLGPEASQQAASFENDNPFQNYTELEGGGLEVFRQVIDARNYVPFQWKVRHFRENFVNEVTFSFTPSGSLYGFTETLSDTLIRNEITSDSALQLASLAALYWGHQLADYQLVEKSMERMPGNRLDHTFVFERKEGNIADSRFRLAVVVSGDKVSAVKPFVKIPEDFERRYAEMRSENNLIGSVGQAILFLVYGLIGTGMGIFFLMKQRFLQWKKAMFWSVGIGLGTGLLYMLNELPLLWMNYDTSQASGTFLGQQLLSALLNSVLMAAIVFVSALAGEGLGRFVFKNQLQFWKVWGKEAGASIQVLGQTLGAYLFVPIFLAIDIVYYLFTTNTLGWWNPAGTLSDPNILAQHFPWFGSIAISLQAGFWEEIICRAVPLAGIYLLVRRLKSKNFWMLLTLLLQTIIFGMLHANYPQLPAFARVFEMIIPFLIFGLIYLRFGLLPVIIAHYAIDVFWISLPLWVANSEGIWWNRLAILFLFFLPLLIVFYWRIKNKQWNIAPLSVRNRAFQPETKKVSQPKNEKIEASTLLYTESRFLGLRYLLPAAVIGLMLWLIITLPVKHQTPDVKLNKDAAIEMAVAFLKTNYAVVPEEWSVHAAIDERPGLAHRFIWQQYPIAYDDLQETFLSPPAWDIRVLKQKGSVEDRSEEYRVWIGIDGRLLGYQHKWPEKRPGDTLDEKAAMEKAHAAIQNFGVKEIGSLSLVSITPSKLDERTDWLIEFSDTLNYTVGEGQGRYQIALAGSEVNGFKQYVFVPENWERDNKKQQSTLRILTLLSNLFRYAILIVGIVIGFINWSRKRFSIQMFSVFVAIVLGFSILDLANSWSDLTHGYFTGLPYTNFLAMTLIGSVIGLVFLSLGVGVLGGFSCEMARNDVLAGKALVKALLLGVIWTGLQAAVGELNPQMAPKWIWLAPLNAKLPWLSPITDSWTRFVFYPAFMMILFYLARRFANNDGSPNILTITFIFIAGFVASGGQADVLNAWLLTGVCGGTIFILLYFLIGRHLSWIPLIFVVPLVFHEISRLLTSPNHGILWGSSLTIILFITAAWLWYKGIMRCNQH